MNALKAAVTLVQKLFKNVLDNPNDEKFRTVKLNNQKVKDVLTKYFNGIGLMKLVGFQQVYDN